MDVPSILNNLKSLVKHIHKKGWTHKFNKKMDQNNRFRGKISQSLQKLLTFREEKEIEF